MSAVARQLPSSAVVRALLYLPFILYPVLVFFGLPYFGVRGAALAMVGAMVLSLVFQLWGRGRISRLTWIPLVTVGLLSVSALLNNLGWMLAVPSALSMLLFALFFPTLFLGRPMVERFARVQHPDLRADEVSWCRGWTMGWCGFFVVNASLAAALALWAPLFWWTFYTSVVAYVLMGTMFASEWTVRKLRFRRFSDGPVDQWLSQLGKPS